MSHINFDFLTESFLFGYGLEDNFSALSDYELEKELNRYREYVISNMGEICRESVIIISAKQFSNEKDSNKIYAFSSIIIALISCIISTVTFVMQFLM